MATGRSGDLLALSGKRAPDEGALADLPVRDGDPGTTLEFPGDAGSNLRLGMKRGRRFEDVI